MKMMMMMSDRLTVLMCVRVRVSGSQTDTQRLQLSMNPDQPGEFRLSLTHTVNNIISNKPVADFDLRTVMYEVRSPRCHELRLLKAPHSSFSFTFRSEQEAQEWATVMLSSLREAHRVANIASHPTDDEVEYLQPAEQNVALSLSDKEDLCAELARAIEAGDTQAAVQHVTALTQQRMSLTVSPAPKHSEDGEISLAVAVEDATSSCCVTIKVVPHMTVASLKQQMFVEYGFHPRVQRWVMGQCLCCDERSLGSYGVCADGDTAFLYLLSARLAGLSRQVCQQDQESSLLSSTKPTTSTSSSSTQPAGGSSNPAGHDWRGYSTLPPRLHHSTPGSGGGADKHTISDIMNLELSGPNRQNNTQAGWSCPSCTFINISTRPGCEICSTERPAGPEPSSSQQVHL